MDAGDGRPPRDTVKHIVMIVVLLLTSHRDKRVRQTRVQMPIQLQAAGSSAAGPG